MAAVQPPSWPETPLGFRECPRIYETSETFREVLSSLDSLQNFDVRDKGGLSSPPQHVFRDHSVGFVVFSDFL